MRIASTLEALPDVRVASLVMGTPANKEMLADAGLLGGDAETASASDLIIAIDAEDSALDDAITAADAALASRSTVSASNHGEPPRPRSIAQVDADLALVSTPGRYAAAETLKALRSGMSVFLFSDNVPLEQELMLKREAHARGLLVMGPDCGTAIIGGVPLGFANNVAQGDIGLVGASGTGLQQVSTLIDRWGAGVSQVIGVGSHDLSAVVGGISMIDALDALGKDPRTRVIVLVSKPPEPAVAEAVLARAATLGKPVIVAFIGGGPDAQSDAVEVVDTLQEAARAAVRVASGAEPERDGDDDALDVAPLGGERRLLRSMYAGGTFAYEARMLLEPRLGPIAVEIDPRPGGRALRLPQEHLVLDLGDDRFTVGRPHPMIDPSVRREFLRAAVDDPRTAVVVFDVVLGHGAADDPAGDLATTISDLAGRADAPHVVSFVVGTPKDPQGLEWQVGALKAAGARIAASSTAAVRLAETLLAAQVAA
jgi:FdrA protein